jgi:hypothetical protein
LVQHESLRQSHEGAALPGAPGGLATGIRRAVPMHQPPAPPKRRRARAAQRASNGGENCPRGLALGPGCGVSPEHPCLASA